MHPSHRDPDWTCSTAGGYWFRFRYIEDLPAAGRRDDRFPVLGVPQQLPRPHPWAPKWPEERVFRFFFLTTTNHCETRAGAITIVWRPRHRDWWQECGYAAPPALPWHSIFPRPSNGPRRKRHCPTVQTAGHSGNDARSPRLAAHREKPTEGTCIDSEA